MQDIVGQVLGVTGRATRNGNTVYDIQFSDGNKYSTFVPELATKAQQLTGQQVTARVEVKQNGKYTNYNLEDIAPVGQLPPLAMPVAGGTPLAAGVPMVGAPPQVAPGIPIVQGGGGMPPEREARIVKQSVLATAFEFVGSIFTGAGPEALGEAKDAALSLAQELYGLVQGAPAAQPVAEAQPIPNDGTPQGVAAAVNDAAGAPVVQPGSVIPW